MESYALDFTKTKRDSGLIFFRHMTKRKLSGMTMKKLGGA